MSELTSILEKAAVCPLFFAELYKHLKFLVLLFLFIIEWIVLFFAFCVNIRVVAQMKLISNNVLCKTRSVLVRIIVTVRAYF